MKRLLLLDDSETIRMTLSANLEDNGFEVTEAGSLKEARAKLGEGTSFDVAVLDLWLPDGRGVELVAEIRAASPSTRIVLLTGDAPPKTSNVDLVLLKGGSVKLLLEQIKALV
jgi:DNA-binding NtrC family response regulator